MPSITLLPPPRRVRNYELARAINVFLDTLAASGASEKTVKSYRAALKSFQEHVGGDTPVREIGEDHYTSWLSHLRRRNPPPSKSTLHYYSIFVRRFLQWLGNVDELPAVPGGNREYSHALSWEQVEALMSAARDLRELAMIALMAESGLRASELLSLTWRDVDLGKGMIRVRGKYGKERIVLLGPVAREALSALFEETTPRLYDRLFPFTYQALYKKVKNLAKRAGIDPRLVRPHVLRHTFATEALRRGMSLPALQRLLGHSDIKVTQRYLHLVTEDIEREYVRVFGEPGDLRHSPYNPYMYRARRIHITG